MLSWKQATGIGNVLAYASPWRIIQDASKSPSRPCSYRLLSPKQRSNTWPVPRLVIFKILPSKQTVFIPRHLEREQVGSADQQYETSLRGARFGRLSIIESQAARHDLQVITAAFLRQTDKSPVLRAMVSPIRGRHIRTQHTLILCDIAVRQLRWLVASFPPGGPGLDPRSDIVRFVTDDVAEGVGFIRVRTFSPPTAPCSLSSYHRRCVVSTQTAP
jgi:hypothetical protein